MKAMGGEEAGKGDSYGILIFYLCAIPAGLAIPFFYFAGLRSKKIAQDKIKAGE